jgi:steroid delta-isomerase-like uncharacterized protein
MNALIENYYNFFNSKQFDKMLDLVDESIIHEVNQSKVQIGKIEFKKFLAEMNEYYDEELTDITIFENGERFAAEFYCSGVYKQTSKGLPKAENQKYNIRVGAFFEVKSGKIMRVTNYYNLREWIKQVSLC